VKLYQRRDVNETLSSILQNYPKTRKSIDKETVFARLSQTSFGHISIKSSMIPTISKPD